MKLEIRNVKSFRGREGFGMNATLYVDGKKAAFIIDEGNGGAMRFEWVDAQSEQQVKKYVGSLPVDEFEGVLVQQDLDWVVSKLADEHEEARCRRKR